MFFWQRMDFSLTPAFSTYLVRSRPRSFDVWSSAFCIVFFRLLWGVYGTNTTPWILRSSFWLDDCGMTFLCLMFWLLYVEVELNVLFGFCFFLNQASSDFDQNITILGIYRLMGSRRYPRVPPLETKVDTPLELAKRTWRTSEGYPLASHTEGSAREHTFIQL